MTKVYEDWKLYGLKLIYSGTAILASELIYRLLLIVRELLLHKRHYHQEHRFLTTIKYGLYFELYAKICYAVMFVLLTYGITQVDDIFGKILQEAYYLAPLYLLFRFVNLSHNRIGQADWIRAGNGLDYATGMASNYFHGYLNLQLPNWGDNNKGIRERIRDYEDKHNVTFAFKKLIIVVPDSLHSAPKIDSPYLESADPLETVVKGRAGVKRPFKNDVYRFTERINGRIYYIAVEGATPLLSFKEAMNNSLTGTPEMQAMQREILMQFYKSVKRYTSKCEYTRNECEIVYFPDYNENGEQNDVGLYLMNYIKRRLFNLSDDR